jgi:O-antigen ligase
VNVGAWRGIYGQKNTLGRLMAIGAILFALYSMSQNKRKWVAWTGVFFLASLVLLAKSVTSFAALLTVLGTLPLLLTLRWRQNVSAIPVIWTGSMLVSMTVLTVLIANAEPLLATIGKNPTLSSRLPLWGRVLEYIAERPLLGYGYSGFWSVGGKLSPRIILTNLWIPDHAHSGFLDLWVELGLVGLGIVLLHLLVSIRKGMILARQTTAPDGLWPLAYLTFILLVSVFYSVLLSQWIFFWLLYVATVFSVQIRLNSMRAESKIGSQASQNRIEVRAKPKPA